MSVLAFDTATSATTVALASSDGAAASELRDDPAAGARPGHAERLLELVRELVEATPTGWDGVRLIAVGVGPGTFTGLRIGIATAQGLAKARGLPLAGVPTLRSLALGACPHARKRGCESVLAAVDARRGELFAAAWAVEEVQSGNPLLEPVALAPERLLARLGELGLSPLAVGDGAVKSAQALERGGAMVPDAGLAIHRVCAIQHCRLAAAYVADRPENVLPSYLRAPDAEQAIRRQRE